MVKKKNTAAKKTAKKKSATKKSVTKQEATGVVANSSGTVLLKSKRSVVRMDLERLVEMDLVRTTEAAALNAYYWLGKGNARAAHAAAVDAIRGAMDMTSVSATVIFGDGLKPQPDGIAAGEKLGNWLKGSLDMAMAIVPIDGIDLVARGLWGAMSFLVAASQDKDGTSLMPVPCRYMEKIAYGPKVKAGPEKVDLRASVRDNLEIIAMKLGKRVQDLDIAVLDRPRHEKLIRDIRKADASVRLISDGDIAACMAPSQPDTGIDAYMGTGGAAEAVISAAAIRCMGGDILARVAPVNDKEKRQVTKILSPEALTEQFNCEKLAPGDNVIFCATGISDGSILRGIHIDGHRASTSSVVMRTRYRTVRKIKAVHDLSRKTIHLRSAQAETKL